MKKALFLLALPFFLLSSSGYGQSACEQIVQRITTVKMLFSNLPQAVKSSSQWQNLNWLNANLGHPTDSRAITATVYTWKDHSLLSYDGATKEAVGFPNQNLPSVAEATEILGQPLATKTYSLREFTWSCPGGSSLTVTTDESGEAIKKMEAINCTTTGCAIFLSANSVLSFYAPANEKTDSVKEPSTSKTETSTTTTTNSMTPTTPTATATDATISTTATSATTNGMTPTTPTATATDATISTTATPATTNGMTPTTPTATATDATISTTPPAALGNAAPSASTVNQVSTPVTGGSATSSVTTSNVTDTTMPTDNATTPVQTTDSQPTAADTSMAKYLSAYNEHFQISLQNISQLNTDMITRLKAYYAALRECRPGTYQYGLLMMSIGVFSEAVISGMENGQCTVQVTTYSSQKPDDKTIQQCKFAISDLQYFDDQTAEAYGGGNFTFDSSNPPKVDTIMNTQCQLVNPS